MTEQYKDRPILFSGEMVKAILAGNKTVTRRVIKSSINNTHDHENPVQLLASWPLSKLKYFCHDTAKATFAIQSDVDSYVTEHVVCPYGKVGDRLWLRESMHEDADGVWVFSADNEPIGCDDADDAKMMAWVMRKTTSYCPSIHMPRWASRITLEVTNVSVGRVQDISEADAIKEGIDWSSCNHAYAQTIGTFATLWDKINAERGYSWDSNPYVWRVEFKRVDTEA